MEVYAHIVDPLVVKDVSIRFTVTEQGVNTYRSERRYLSEIREPDESSVILKRDEFIASLLIPSNTEHHIAVLKYLVTHYPESMKNLRPIFTAISKYYASQKHVPQYVIDLYTLVLKEDVFKSYGDHERLKKSLESMKKLASPAITTPLGQFVRISNLCYKKKKYVAPVQHTLPVHISGPLVSQDTSSSGSKSKRPVSELLESICGNMTDRSIEKLHMKGEENWGGPKIPIRVTVDKSISGFGIVGSFVFSFSPVSKTKQSPHFDNGKPMKFGVIVFELSTGTKLEASKFVITVQEPDGKKTILSPNITGSRLVINIERYSNGKKHNMKIVSREKKYKLVKCYYCVREKSTTSQYEQIESIVCAKKISKESVIESLKIAFGEGRNNEIGRDSTSKSTEKKNELPGNSDSSIDNIPVNTLQCIDNNNNDKDLEIVDNGNEDENGELNLRVESERVDLLCPLSRDRIITPVRGEQCEHIQCIDLRYFIDSNLIDNGKKWYMKCPICFRQLLPENLRLDEYMLDIINSSARTRKSATSTTDHDLDGPGYYDYATVEYSTGEYYFDSDDSDNSDSDDNSNVPIIRKSTNRTTSGTRESNADDHDDDDDCDSDIHKGYCVQEEYSDEMEDLFNCDYRGGVSADNFGTGRCDNVRKTTDTNTTSTGKRERSILYEKYHNIPMVDEALDERDSQILKPKRKRRKIQKEIIELSE